MSGARLTAGLECANDVGVRFTLWPSGDSQGPSRVSTGGAVSCASVARTDGAVRAAPAVAGATPQSKGLVRVRGQVCFHTPAPALRGSLPNQVSVPEGRSAPLRGGGSPVRQPSSRPAGVSALAQRTGRGPAENARPWATGNVEP